ncbi:MAG TPA: glycosyltransferase family 2 protein [Terriglobia bacterium]|nr:glycosyltransferase family 2 protein [Terriglobia bacterium]
MSWVFWGSAALIFYTYLGYPAWLYLRSRWKPFEVRREAISPWVSIVMAVHNEADVLGAKLQNLSELDYPADRLDLVVVSDGSSDGTDGILASWRGERRQAIIMPSNGGKAAALNVAVKAARGDILIFTDARQRLGAEALRCLVENFADAAVGCVSGELLLEQPQRKSSTNGLSLYWTIEKKIRQWEGASGSVVGVTGALYGARREYVPALPVGTILDDVYIPLHVARLGKRVLFDARAQSYDQLANSRREFWRKVRTLAGNYQLVQLAPWLLTASNPMRFRFVSHKLLRLLMPFALLGILVSSLALNSLLYRLALAGELSLCLCSVLVAFHVRLGALSRLGEACSAFLVLNAAAAVAFLYFVTGRRVAWTR